MMKKLGIILLTTIFLLSAFGLLPVKEVSANTGPDIALCTAEPWHEFHIGNHNPGSQPRSEFVQPQGNCAQKFNSSPCVVKKVSSPYRQSSKRNSILRFILRTFLEILRIS
jgi:hypothetical protein